MYCLAGANGLGKSTFLAALNYAITGVVADPSREFGSVQDYYRYSLTYSANFFRGRVSESDRDVAQIELQLKVGDRTYRLVRGLFDPVGLRELEVIGDDGNPIALGLDRATEEERHAAYTSAIVADAGLESFAQLVFLQHFVLTFDERRYLIFWDDKVAQAALFMAFGLEPEKARQADTLRRTLERADSLARNLQWQATGIRKKAEALEGATEDGTTSVELASGHQQLVTEVDELAARLDKMQVELRDFQLRLQDESAQQRAATAEYEDLFEHGLGASRNPLLHPLVATSIASETCGVCGTVGAEIAASIRLRAADHRCPLCGSELESRDDAADQEWRTQLAEIDARVVQHEALIRDASLGISRLVEQVAEAEGALAAGRLRLSEFERENQGALAKQTVVGDALAELSSQYRAQVADIMKRKREQLETRNRARRDLTELQRELAVAYSEAESEFGPRFGNLARDFLGLDLEVDLDLRASTAQLLLSVVNTRRRSPQSLSESQRFFVDIALRMALAQQMSAPGSPACLFIDTPEGSLDIAYESRAGRMFSRFVRDGYQLVMTANINTSQLLIRLAEDCGRRFMHLDRMTEWGSLSEVQASEEHLFDEAYERVADALARGPE